jgi:hypothetical protein
MNSRFYFNCVIISQCQNNIFNNTSFNTLKHITNPFYYRLMHEKVDMLENEKETLQNQIYDLRSLLKKVNTDGDIRLNYIKNKNVSVFSTQEI